MFNLLDFEGFQLPGPFYDMKVVPQREQFEKHYIPIQPLIQQNKVFQQIHNFRSFRSNKRAISIPNS